MHKPKTTTQTTTLDQFTQPIADALSLHEKNIKLYIKGQSKGAAEHFGYSYLAGRELLASKGIIAHGNTKADPNSGFRAWASGRFRVDYRTCSNWMLFSDAIDAKLNSLPDTKQILMLPRHSDSNDGRARHSVRAVTRLNRDARSSILALIPQVMDGKGMIKFLRDSRLLADPAKTGGAKRKPVDPLKANAAARSKASRAWQRIRDDLSLHIQVLARLDDHDLQLNLDALIDAANSHRSLLKERKHSSTPSTKSTP